MLVIAKTATRRLPRIKRYQPLPHIDLAYEVRRDRLIATGALASALLDLQHQHHWYALYAAIGRDRKRLGPAYAVEATQAMDDVMASLSPALTAQ